MSRSGAGLPRRSFAHSGVPEDDRYQLEDGVVAEGIVVVLVLVVGEYAVDAGADHVQEGVVDLVGIAADVEGGDGRCSSG
jgi:hypothetical protein